MKQMLCTLVSVVCVLAVYRTQAKGEPDCRMLVQPRCSTSTQFEVAFDSAVGLAQVSPVPGENNAKGTVEAARCYSQYWSQIPLLSKAVQDERQGREKVPSRFTFKVTRYCDYPVGIDPE